MNEPKFENLLNLALDATEREREKSLQLGVGYEQEDNSWELIVKYSGSLAWLSQEYPSIEVRELMNEYAILRVPQALLDVVANAEEIEYVEKPKRLFFAVNQGKRASCILPLQTAQYGLTGTGVIVACLDSGSGVMIMSSRQNLYENRVPADLVLRKNAENGGIFEKGRART